MIVKSAQKAANNPDHDKDRQLHHSIRRIVKVAKVKQAAVAQLAGETLEGGQDHVEHKETGHRSEEDAPGERLVPEAGALLQAEEDAADGGAEGGRHPRRRPAGDEVSLLVILAEELEDFCVQIEWRGFALGYTGLHNWSNILLDTVGLLLKV